MKRSLPILDEYTPIYDAAKISNSTSVAIAASYFIEDLGRKGVSANTVAAFAADLRLFITFIGQATAVSAITNEHISQFKHFLLVERTQPCNQSSLRRRITTLAAFLRYLEESRLVTAGISIETMPTKMAEHQTLLNEMEIAALKSAAQTLLTQGEPRAWVLLNLILSTGLSKSDCLALHWSDIDREQGLAIIGVYSRRRQVILNNDTRTALQVYKDQKKDETADYVFSCTGRNLEYILARIGRMAGLKANPSFRLLRATAAAHFYADKEDADTVTKQLGISRLTWPAMRRRISQSKATGSLVAE